MHSLFNLFLKGIITLLICAFNASLVSGQYFKQEVLLEEINTFEKHLFNLHPGLDYFTKEETLRSLFTTAKNAIPDSLERQDFFNLLEPIIDEIQCGHTNITFSHKLYKDKDAKKKPSLFPATMTAFENRIFFSSSFKQDWLNIPKGTELLSIDEVSSQEILKVISKTNKGSDGNMTIPETHWSVASFRTTYPRFYGLKEKYKVKVMLPGKTKADLYTLKSISYEELLKNNKENKKEPLSFEFLENDKVALIKLSTFSNESRFKPTKNDLKRAFKEIKEKNIDKLIIDLRNNGGGAISNVNHFLSYLLNEDFKVVKRASLNKNLNKKDLILFQKILVSLSKKKMLDDEIWLSKYNNKNKKLNKKAHFDGDLVVLTNYRSYSASTMFCAMLKSHQRGKIIGALAGGSYHVSFAGFSKYLKLDKTRIRIRIPLMKMVYNVDPDLQERGVGVIPDIERIRTIEDLGEEENDSVKEFAIDYLLHGES